MPRIEPDWDIVGAVRHARQADMARSPITRQFTHENDFSELAGDASESLSAALKDVDDGHCRPTGAIVEPSA
jgi:hypothetical protein